MLPTLQQFTLTGKIVLVTGAGRVYGAALTLIPRELRERYRDDMRQTFEDRAAGCE